jgi:hypothetical protein
VKVFLRCVAVVAAILLALYPLALEAHNSVAIGCAVVGVSIVAIGLAFKRAWTGAVAAAVFCLEYLIVLVTASIELDAFVLVEAILVLVLLETTDIASARADHIEVAVMRNRFRSMAAALTFGGTIGLIVMLMAPALASGRDPGLLVAGAVAAVAAGVGVLIAARRVS